MSWVPKSPVRFTFQAPFGLLLLGHILSPPRPVGKTLEALWFHCLDPTIRSKLPLWRAVMRHCL